MTVQLGYTICYVDDVRSTLDFYNAAFGLVERFITPEGDYGELETGATTLAFAANSLADVNLRDAGGFVRLDDLTRPPGISITLITDDVAGALQAAVAAGARRYVDPTEKPWGQTAAYLLDPNGVLVEIATPVSAGAV